MRRNGNTNTNHTYNPRNVKPQIPLDVDEVDLTLEKFIRQKYDQQLLSGAADRAASRHNTGSTSTRSSEDQPPPLPPKPAQRIVTLHAPVESGSQTPNLQSALDSDCAPPHQLCHYQEAHTTRRPSLPTAPTDMDNLHHLFGSISNPGYLGLVWEVAEMTWTRNFIPSEIWGFRTSNATQPY